MPDFEDYPVASIGSLSSTGGGAVHMSSIVQHQERGREIAIRGSLKIVKDFKLPLVTLFWSQPKDNAIGKLASPGRTVQTPGGIEDKLRLWRRSVRVTLYF